jgi:lysophospholipase L1-like esterase
VIRKRRCVWNELEEETMQNILERMARKQKENLAFNIVALGDSVTNGAFDYAYDMDAVWHNRLKKMLNGIFPELRINMINSGINGDNAAGAYKRLERDVFAYNPDLVIVCLGLNNMDTPIEEMEDVFSKIFSELKDRNIPAIYMSPNMVDSYCNEKEINRLFESQWAIDYAEKLAKKQTSGEVDRLFEAAMQAARQNGELQDDYCATRRYFKYYKDLGVDGALIRAEGKVVAFTIGEILNSDTYVIHVEKALRDVEGGYSMINREFAEYVKGKYPFIVLMNREEDMGDEGLRKAKESYYPDRMEEKCWAELIK